MIVERSKHVLFKTLSCCTFFKNKGNCKLTLKFRTYVFRINLTPMKERIIVRDITHLKVFITLSDETSDKRTRWSFPVNSALSHPAVSTLNTERCYITRLRCSACQSQIPTDGHCSHLIGLFT